MTDIEFSWYKVRLQYGFWMVYQEVCVIAIGPLTNTLLFAFMMKVIQISQERILCFPRILSKAFAWFGFFTVFDFALVTIIDFADQDERGDLFKLYNYFNKQGAGSGFVGYFLTFLIQFMIILLNVVLFYQHILFVHHDQKIADIYLRITGKGRNYFIPDDNELSYRLLNHQYTEGKVNQNRIICNRLEIWDQIDKKMYVAKLIHFYKFISAKSLEPGKAHYSNHFGQIRELSYDRMRTGRGTMLDTALR